MNRTIKSLFLAGAAVIMLAGSQPAMAQPGPGNFDPTEMRQRMMDRYREVLDVKNDDEWKLIKDRIEKVMEARMASGFGGMGMMGRRGGGGPGGGPGGGGGMFGQQSNPEAEALQKAVDDNATKEVIKAKLETYRQARKDKQKKLADAQAELQKILTQKQEAAAVLSGLLE